VASDPSERKHPVFPVPEGFPYKLEDEALDEWAEKFATRLREVTEKGVGYNNEGVVLGYGTMLDLTRSEQFRRHLRRSERIARVALVVAIIAALASIASGIASIVVALCSS
jgi:hypothetical protein